MAYVITDPCLVKTICEQCLGTELCPTEAILTDLGFAFIDPELCIDCGACEALCPHGVVHSIEPVYSQGRWKLMVTKKDKPAVELNRAAAEALRAKA
ncbi:MAG: 4Fe-4S binding protein [Chloroflexi bacterium]|nr:4Fe-4S binding protein [Chloroflexota bacterium]